MYIKQISVFIENRKGRLAEFCRLLGDNGIDMIAITIADTTSFGTVSYTHLDVYKRQRPSCINCA